MADPSTLVFVGLCFLFIAISIALAVRVVALSRKVRYHQLLEYRLDEEITSRLKVLGQADFVDHCSDTDDKLRKLFSIEDNERYLIGMYRSYCDLKGLIPMDQPRSYSQEFVVLLKAHEEARNMQQAVEELDRKTDEEDSAYW